MQKGAGGFGTASEGRSAISTHLRRQEMFSSGENISLFINILRCRASRAQKNNKKQPKALPHDSFLQTILSREIRKSLLI